ncbi:MAG TPA: TIGR04283 family arsenosugar biosynthesis glycosyltransferase [Planctomycetota bacterium]|nr:TIGR04283 family arsenosugar biosynthesis glycosyltransferase [Planctomycetota bacterium]
MSSGARLALLAKPPRRGACKERLAAALGEGRAARLARAMLLDTWSAISAWVSSQPDVDLVLAIAGAPDEYPLLQPTPSVLRQVEGDLGRRMATLCAGALGQRGRVLLLGTDSPGLPVTHIAGALAALADADVVLGPAADGGFWCLGVRGGPQSLNGNTWLDGLAWHQPDTLAQVEDRARRIGLRVARAAPWWDVDRESDLPSLRALLAAEPDRAPETALELARPDGESPLSIVIPTLQESVRLDECLRAVREQPGPLEVVVADGGSSDRSPERAAASGATVLVTGPGRGRQLAAGARLATGDVLLFLHVDVRLPSGGTDLVRGALADPRAEAGAFVTRTVADPSLRNLAGPLLRLADLRSRLTRHPYGDQALFVRRAAYEAAGGFRPLPICEDYDLARRLAARAPLARIGTPVTVSGRRVQGRPVRALFVNRMIPPLFRLGVDPALLARMYRQP